jgi:hypothetical protein
MHIIPEQIPTNKSIKLCKPSAVKSLILNSRCIFQKQIHSYKLPGIISYGRGDEREREDKAFNPNHPERLFPGSYV